MRCINYCPPDTDSENDYDGFDFGADFEEKSQQKVREFDPEQCIYESVVLNPDLEILKRLLSETKYPIDKPIKDGFTLLLHACGDGNLKIVRFLVEEKNANVNKQIDSYTPLIQACSCTKDSNIVASIVQLLLKYGAVVNVSDKYGTTPFMLACKNGHAAVVEKLLNDASLDAVDNQGCTAIYHAIENNHPKIIKVLVAAGANIQVTNYKGYNPRQVVQFCGFYDLLELFPKEQECFTVSSKYLSYTSLRDYIPRIFAERHCPEYFQEINTILFSLNMETFLGYFVKARCSLEEFLLLTDKRLIEVGIQYPIHRMKLRKGLLNFHLHHWSYKSIARISKTLEDNFYNIFMITANQIQQIILIRSSLRYIRHNTICLGQLSNNDLKMMLFSLVEYQKTISKFTDSTIYLASFSPQYNPLYINYDKYLCVRKLQKIKNFLRYSAMVVGVSLYVYLKFNKK